MVDVLTFERINPNMRISQVCISAPHEAHVCTVHPTHGTLHPTPYTLHPTPYTLHPTPDTRHPTPYTLHATPLP